MHVWAFEKKRTDIKRPRIRCQGQFFKKINLWTRGLYGGRWNNIFTYYWLRQPVLPWFIAFTTFKMTPRHTQLVRPPIARSVLRFHAEVGRRGQPARGGTPLNTNINIRKQFLTGKEYVRFLTLNTTKL